MKQEKSCGCIILNEKNEVLLIHHNAGHWDFPKGHVEEGETEVQTAIREVKEETGLTLTSYRFRGIVTFITDGLEEAEYMHLYTADEYEGEMIDCDEGTLEWVEKSKVLDLPIWEGDRLIFKEINNGKYFKLRLEYENDVLVTSEYY